MPRTPLHPPLHPPLHLQRRHALATLTALAWGLPADAQDPPSRSFGPTQFAETVLVAPYTLKLNGAGVRFRDSQQLYAVGLYLPTYASTPEAVYRTPGTRRLEVVMLQSMPLETLGHLFTRGITRNSPAALTNRQLPAMARMGHIFSRITEIQAGEVVAVDCVPALGTVIALRGFDLIEPFDEGFFNLLLSVWLGEQPADLALKQALLGHDPYSATPGTRRA